jgi:5-formyltetrahydrofolate cyclo-ligase
MNKAEIRQLALEKRNALSEADKKTKSDEISKLLESLELFQNATNILAYFSHHKEVDTLSLLRKWMHEKSFFLPRLTSESSFLALPISSFDELEMNRYGIPEPPIPSGEEERASLDLIIVPGVAFDRRGNRIGMGKGYYDRFLAGQKKVPKVALAYSEQVLDSVPKEPYDESIDMIITENEIIRCKVSP